MGKNRRCKRRKKENSFLLSAKDAAVTYHTPARRHQPKSNYNFMLEKKGGRNRRRLSHFPFAADAKNIDFTALGDTLTHTPHAARFFHRRRPRIAVRCSKNPPRPKRHRRRKATFSRPERKRRDDMMLLLPSFSSPLLPPSFPCNWPRD